MHTASFVRPWLPVRDIKHNTIMWGFKAVWRLDLCLCITLEVFLCEIHILYYIGGIKRWTTHTTGNQHVLIYFECSVKNQPTSFGIWNVCQERKMFVINMSTGNSPSYPIILSRTCPNSVLSWHEAAMMGRQVVVWLWGAMQYLFLNSEQLFQLRPKL